MNGEEIRIGPKSAFASDAEAVKYVLELRKDLIFSKPITDEMITKLDNWLAAQKLPFAVAVQIWTRSMWVSAVDYEREKDPYLKHLRLLSIRDHFEEFRACPEEVQELLRPHWLEWLDVLKTEEEKWEQANGAA
jgi:hypothetical protein